MTLYTPEQVAEITQLHPETVRRLCQRGLIPGAKKIGGSWRIVRTRFDAWLEEDDPTPGDRLEAPPQKRRRADLRAIEGGQW